MSYYEYTVPQFIRILGQAKVWLDKAETHATNKSFAADTLLTARLAPNQFAFARQIQILTDNTKGAAARLAGVQPPPFADDEKTITELRARIDKTIAFLETLTPAQFEGAAERPITLPFWAGKAMTGADYLTRFALPNLYFHAVTAYAILRHNGVDIGKTDFLGDIPLYDV